MKNLFDFPYSLTQIMPSDGISMFKGNNKNIRTRCETCLKLKLKNKYTVKQCYTVFCCLYCYL